uniref:insulin-like growth factor-binding protein-related protein 1 n=1 Tax=Ciona intestinalis TaxID=7719 RepID=UPI000180C673|nr:insulin-like growth factor-binding protein-related protein 1 [Ciona intestinalis]|eukprot:XP_002127631.1 insulin-like growth factor-binding protein-related protein 1 [Ciona intestinalis]
MRSFLTLLSFALFVNFRLIKSLPRHQRLRHHTLRHVGDHINSVVEQDNDVSVTNGTDQPIRTKHRHHIKRHPLLFDWTTSCGVCDPEQCSATPTSCPGGLIRDACDCCYVCGNLEDTPCDLPGAMFRFGNCGEGLVCTPVEPDDVGLDASDSYCACAARDVICGSDGRTYSNPCRFRRASGRVAGLEIARQGPCRAAPQVEIPPMNQTAESGSSAVFSCSVSGFPLAWFEWTLNGESVFQPNLDDGVTVQVRSGPLPYQVTTWLEIDRVMTSHAGLFTCIAKNEFGISNATARLNVVAGDFPIPNYYVYRRKHYAFNSREVATESTNSNYLRSHILPPDDVTLTLGQVGRRHDDVTSDDVTNYHDDSNTPSSEFPGTEIQPLLNNDVITDVTKETIDDVLSHALRAMVKPKMFKDVFFDDDDLSEGSGIL